MKFRNFLEERCKLSVSSTRPTGREVIQHDEAFRVFKRWLFEGSLKVPFSIMHVDAHADLGAGLNQTFTYMDKLLALPLDQRASPDFGPNFLNDGNYLLGAIANRWVSDLTYVYPTGGKHDIRHGPSDLPDRCFLDGGYKTGYIQLKGSAPGEVMKAKPTPVHVEPCVPFSLIDEHSFVLPESLRITHMILAQSPQYTPKSADPLSANTS